MNRTAFVVAAFGLLSGPVAWERPALSSSTLPPNPIPLKLTSVVSEKNHSVEPENEDRISFIRKKITEETLGGSLHGKVSFIPVLLREAIDFSKHPSSASDYSIDNVKVRVQLVRQIAQSSGYPLSKIQLSLVNTLERIAIDNTVRATLDQMDLYLTRPGDVVSAIKTLNQALKDALSKHDRILTLEERARIQTGLRQAKIAAIPFLFDENKNYVLTAQKSEEPYPFVELVQSNITSIREYSSGLGRPLTPDQETACQKDLAAVQVACIAPAISKAEKELEKINAEAWIEVSVATIDFKVNQAQEFSKATGHPLTEAQEQLCRELPTRARERAIPILIDKAEKEIDRIIADSSGTKSVDSALIPLNLAMKCIQQLPRPATPKEVEALGRVLEKIESQIPTSPLPPRPRPRKDVA